LRRYGQAEGARQLSQSLGVRIYRMLGGGVSERMPVYAIDGGVFIVRDGGHGCFWKRTGRKQQHRQVRRRTGPSSVNHGDVVGKPAQSTSGDQSRAKAACEPPQERLRAGGRLNCSTRPLR
jgi:hypothetical protein